MNSVNVLGRLTACALPNGTTEKPVAKFSIAVQRPYKNAQGERDCDFLDCVAFGKLADFALSRLQKGERIGVSGALRVSSYVDSQGIKRRAWEIVAENIYFADGKPQTVENPPLDYPFEEG